MLFICILRQIIAFFKRVLCYFSHFSNDFCVIFFLHVKISIPITTEHITILIHWDVDSPISIPRSLSSYRANSSANLKTAYKTRYSCRLFAFLPFLRHISPYIHSTARDQKISCCLYCLHREKRYSCRRSDRLCINNCSRTVIGNP